jgi:hypothetical protein
MCHADAVLSPLYLTRTLECRTTHYVSEFRTKIEKVIKSAPYNGSRRALARASDIDHAHLTRMLAGQRGISPTVVGQIARLLPRKEADELIVAYLRDVAAEVAESAHREPVTIR